MPLARRGDAAVAVPPMWGLELVMQQLAVGDGGDNDDDEEEDDDEGPCRLPVVAQSQCLSCRRFSLVAGVGCLYCEGDNTDDDSFSYEDWEACSEPEEEHLLRATPVTFCGFKKSFLCDSSPPLRPADRSQDCSQLAFALPQKHRLTAEEAERNAEELVAEEERVKRKAEKKRLKKKRQKDRKRQEKRNQELDAGSQAQPAAPSDKKRGGPLTDVANVLKRRPSELEGGSSLGPSETLASPGCSSEEELEEELDLTSTFVSKARLKVSSKPPLRKEKTEKGKPVQPEKTEHQALRPGLQKTPVEQSLVLADCGNETAKCGRYWEAVLLFTEAVKLNPREYRFFGNRSFCYEKLQCYPEALHDARLALHLQPGWPKGLFRQGKALMGLKQYADAARTFEELLQVDGFRGDAATQLHRCHVQLVLRNNFAPCAAAAAPPGWSGLAQAAPPPLPGGRPLASCSPQVGGPLASFSITNSKYPMEVTAAPTSVREWFAVWVGNLTPKITQDVLLRYFQPFGPIDSIRCLPQKFCAFVNYTSREAAEAAFVALQGADVAGRKLQLQLKHPVHATPPVSKASSSSQLPVKREPAPPPTACGCPGQNATCAKGGGCSFRRLPQRGAAATKLQQS
ncbi:tetratricopeptide repeat protein 31 [Sphaerodactylus townsendi]|uniref:tetratricopeptide repeat protein 31 n=1 Tax=Sphaerodactylus townsendi TaxID=933632 RepID=UPI0020266397|nr:tetratricopeptide repeat protein 31 [Sphaerodactylus townsendi]